MSGPLLVLGDTAYWQGWAERPLALPIDGLEMERINAYRFYQAGCEIHPLGQISDVMDAFDMAIMLIKAFQSLNHLEHTLPLDISRIACGDLRGAVAEAADAIRAAISSKVPAPGLPEEQIRDIQIKFKRFEETFPLNSPPRFGGM